MQRRKDTSIMLMETVVQAEFSLLPENLRGLALDAVKLADKAKKLKEVELATAFAAFGHKSLDLAEKLLDFEKRRWPTDVDKPAEDV
jgi:hypothetical protein